MYWPELYYQNVRTDREVILGLWWENTIPWGNVAKQIPEVDFSLF